MPAGSYRNHDRSALLFAVALMAVTSPALRVWVHPALPWWTLYALWLVLIALAAAIGLRRR